LAEAKATVRKELAEGGSCSTGDSSQREELLAKIQSKQQ
jgi:hypothetical protein